VGFEFESGIVLSYFSFIFVSFGESCLLVSWCAGGRCGMMCNDEDHGRSRRPGAEDQGWSHRSGTRWSDDREVGWRRVRSALCTWRRGARVSWLGVKQRLMVCEWFGLKTTWTVFAGLASKPVATVSSGLTSKHAATVSDSLALKPAVTVFSGLASKPVAMLFSSLASKLVVTVFSSLASKLVATVSPGLTSKLAVGFLVEPQNQDGEGFSGLGLKTGSYGLVIWASKSPRRFLGLGIKTK
jgi:hypothetical protein